MIMLWSDFFYFMSELVSTGAMVVTAYCTYKLLRQKSKK
jgi:cytochrome bd-type quinol oxidase subunit 1